MQYRRTFVPGGTYFFTVVAAQRRKLFCDEGTIQLVRQAFHHVNTNRPFMINAMVILPDHLHCLWTLPATDDDYPTRWRLIRNEADRHSARWTLAPRTATNNLEENAVQREERARNDFRVGTAREASGAGHACRLSSRPRSSTTIGELAESEY